MGGRGRRGYSLQQGLERQGSGLRNAQPQRVWKEEWIVFQEDRDAEEGF